MATKFKNGIYIDGGNADAASGQVYKINGTEVLSSTKVLGLTVTSTTGTLTVANGKTLTASNSITLAGTDSTTMTFPSTSGTVATLNTANTFTTGPQTISPSSDVKGIVVKNGVSSNPAASIQEWQDFSGNVLADVNANGAVRTGNAFASTTGGLTYMKPNHDTSGIGFIVQNAAHKGVVIKAAASQTANLQEWQNNSGTVLTKINASGELTSAKETISPISDAPSNFAASSTATTGSLTASTQYIYAITSLNASGVESYPNYTSFTLSASQTAIKLDWTAVSGSTGYRIYRIPSTALTTGFVNVSYYSIASGLTITYTDTGASATGTGTPPNQSLTVTGTIIQTGSLNTTNNFTSGSDGARTNVAQVWRVTPQTSNNTREAALCVESAGSVRDVLRVSYAVSAARNDITIGDTNTSLIRNITLSPGNSASGGSIVMNGSINKPYLAVTSLNSINATNTLGSNHYTLDCTSGGSYTINLPSAVGITGRIYNIKNSQATGNTITVAAATLPSQQTIDGANTKTLTNQYSLITIQSNGANWIVLATI